MVLLQRILGMNPRELRRSLPLFAYLFLVMGGSVASKAARDALFLERYRAVDLPFADIVIALFVGVAASIYIRAGERLNLRNLQVASLLGFAASALGFWWWATRPGEENPTLFLLIYVWVGILSVLVPAQVWTLANFVLTTREAKRSFGLVGSGAILGWIVGGLATRVAVGQYGTEVMLLVTALSYLVCVGLVLVIWRFRPGRVDDELPVGDSGGLIAALEVIAGSRYLKAIGAVILLSSLATTVEAWQFKAMAKAAIPDTDALAMFFGTFNVAAGVAALLLQLLLTGRVLRHAGIGLTLFIVPLALSATSIGLLATGTLLAATLLRASDQVLRYSIDKATIELLYLPVPASQTFSVKSFIDTVVYRMGDGLGGLVVLAFATVLGWGPVDLAWVLLVLLGGWMAAAAVARTEYVENLQESILQHRLDAERGSAPVLERMATDILSARLSGDTAEIVYALGLFEMAHDRAVHPAVRGLLTHPAPEVRRRAVALLSRADDLSVRDQVQQLLHDPDLEVRTEALLYLTEHGHVDPLASIESVGDFEDFSIRASMVAFLARPGRAQNAEAARMMLAKMAEEAGPDGQRTRLEAARLIGFLPDLFDRELRLLLQDEDSDVARAAITAAAKLKKRIFVGRIIERMEEPALVPVAIEALASFGDRIVGTLRDFLVDAEMPIDVRREIPSVLLAIGTVAAQNVLTESVLDNDVVLRYHCIAALNKLGQLHPARPVDRKIIESVLAAEILGHYRSYQVMGTLTRSLSDDAGPVRQGLAESMSKEQERIFRLLKMLYPAHDLHSAYVGLQSPDPVVHDNALEFLETILPPEMRSVLIPILDREVSVAARIERANQLLGAELGTREEAVEVLTKSADPWLRSCAAYAIGELHLMRLAPVLEAWARDPDPLLKAAAVEAQRKLKEAVAKAAGVGMV
ncbi:MAG: HEAT repeat domain-containing protein [Acidobacteria bacterium]|nr:HEAT repeat domain-containing protein [Acidobacteriota bacterium]